MIDEIKKMKILLIILISVVGIGVFFGIQYPIGLLLCEIIFRSHPSVAAAIMAGGIFEVIVMIITGIVVMIHVKTNLTNGMIMADV